MHTRVLSSPTLNPQPLTFNFFDRDSAADCTDSLLRWTFGPSVPPVGTRRRLQIAGAAGYRYFTDGWRLIVAHVCSPRVHRSLSGDPS
jgi:hypothetical protein